ncbi:MAG: serine/threonine protein kinase [Clostridia bacterium]|nr:serine/threonine protein kinase [Clostridia bacterium]
MDYEKQIIKQIDGITNIKSLNVDAGQREVFKAVHKKYGNVVIKVVKKHDTDERVQREISINTSNNLSNVPKIYEYGFLEMENDKVLYTIEEYIDGSMLRNVLEDNKKLPLKDSIKLLETLLLLAIEFERIGIVHRDIKPDNIIMTKNNDFYLLDFGIIRVLNMKSLTRTEFAMGPNTPGYAPPEQFRNFKKDIDIRTDLFAIGVTVYECITGENPFRKNATDPLDILYRTITVFPPEYTIEGDSDRQLISFLTVLMSKMPSRRPKDAKTAYQWFKAILPTIQYE